jgi:hypothetical protein
MSGRKSTQSFTRALAQALRRDLDLGRKLTSLAQAQTAALVVNDAELVGRLEAEARALVADMPEREAARRRAITALALAAGASSDGGQPPPLAELALQLPLDEARMLLAHRTAILQTEKRLRDVNERNRTLLKSALDYVEFAIRTYTTLALKPARYGSNPNAVATPTFYVDRTA